MRVRVKRCNVCASKLDKQGNCPWDGCPASPKYQTEEKETKQHKNVNSILFWAMYL